MLVTDKQLKEEFAKSIDRIVGVEIIDDNSYPKFINLMVIEINNIQIDIINSTKIFLGNKTHLDSIINKCEDRCNLIKLKCEKFWEYIKENNIIGNEIHLYNVNDDLEIEKK